MAAGPVDLVPLTLLPVITGRTGAAPVLTGAADFDLEPVEHRTFDGHVLEVTHRPALHGWSWRGAVHSRARTASVNRPVVAVVACVLLIVVHLLW